MVVAFLALLNDEPEVGAAFAAAGGAA